MLTAHDDESTFCVRFFGSGRRVHRQKSKPIKKKKEKKRLYIQFVAQRILSVSITWAAQFHRHSVWSVPSSRYMTELIRFGILNDWIYSTGKQEDLTGCVRLTSPPSCFFPCFDWPPPPQPPPRPLRNSPRYSRPLSFGPPPF